MLNVDFFESLINDARESTKRAVASSPFLTKHKNKAADKSDKVSNIKPGSVCDIPEEVPEKRYVLGLRSKEC